MPFLIIFVIIPILEISVFLAVGEQIGLLTTLLLALLTAIIGGILVKQQGMQTLMALQKSLGAGKMPMNELFDGFCLIFAGATLITPGFVTDTIGFLLLIPAVRHVTRNYLKTHTSWAMQSRESTFTHHSTIDDPNVIEAEYKRVDDDQP